MLLKLSAEVARRRLMGLCANALALCLAAAPAHADDLKVDVGTRGGLYLDDDNTQVITTTAAVGATAFEHARVRVHGLLDIVSSASVDVVSAATDRWDETRKEFGAEAGYIDDRRAITASYRRSVEADWASHTVGLGGTHDLLKNQLELGLGFAFTHNDVGRADDDTFSQTLRVYAASLSAVVVAGKDDVFSVTYAPAYLAGYQASPYRFVRFSEPGVIGTVSAPEVVPDRRLRHAVVVSHNHHLLTDSALRSHARAYLDDWGVLSGTLGSEYVHGLGRFEPSLFARGYYQKGARFYQDDYVSHRRYMTADRELSPFWDLFAGLRFAYRVQAMGFLELFRAEAKLTGFWFWFRDFSRLPERRGFTAELGLGGEL